MCFSTKSSITSWTIALVASIYLYKRNGPGDKSIAIFTITFTLIQLLEAGLWMNQQQNVNSTTQCNEKSWCIFGSNESKQLNINREPIDENPPVDERKRKINSLLTKFVLLALWLQPLVHCASVYATVQSKILLGGVLVFCITLFIAIIAMLKKPVYPGGEDEWQSKPGEKGHLVWTRPALFGEEGSVATGTDFVELLDKTPFTSMMYLAGLFLPPLFLKPVGKGLTMSGFGVLSFFVAKWFSSPEEFSSNWCFISVLYPLIAIAYPGVTNGLSKLFQ